VTDVVFPESNNLEEIHIGSTMKRFVIKNVPALRFLNWSDDYIGYYTNLKQIGIGANVGTDSKYSLQPFIKKVWSVVISDISTEIMRRRG
jgi:hypothetical protein